MQMILLKVLIQLVDYDQCTCRILSYVVTNCKFM